MQPRLGLIGWLLLALVTMRPAWAAAQNPRGEDLAVIVHPAMPVSGISLGTLRQVFLGDQQFWRGDARVTLFVQAQGSSERAALLNQIYRMQEPEFKRYWIAKTCGFR